jgi:hypothetical protein
MKTNLNDRPNINALSTDANGALAWCRKTAALIERLRDAILSEYQTRLGNYQHLVRLAVNEAEALAWQTDFPLLVFPALATEKVRAVTDWQTRQELLKRPHARLARAA